MRVLLIDADSKIPNLALMKLSTFHKEVGDTVELIKFNIPYYPTRKKQHNYVPYGYDKVYCSTIFDNSIKYIHNSILCSNNVIFGGTGYSLDITLPNNIEELPPDYSIYPENRTSYGFISRGCIRNCYFCKVPSKEGWIHQVNTINNIVKHKKVKFLDNNILALPNCINILEELVQKQIKCQFNQGLDIRLINKENSYWLSKMNYLGNYIFAFDDWSYLKQIERGILLLSWRKDWQLKFFVYIHPDMQLKNIINRIKWLKQHKCLPYIMRDISCWNSKYNSFYVDISSWCNQVNLFKKMSFSEFLEKRHTNKRRIEFSRNLYKEGVE